MSTALSIACPPAALASLQPWEDYQRANERIFSTPESWRWFVRQHRGELIARGGLCYIAGRVFVVSTVFDAVVLEIGLRLAAARATADLA